MKCQARTSARAACCSTVSPQEYVVPTRQELLVHLWRQVINANLNQASLVAEIERAAARPKDPFADTGQALARLLAIGRPA